LIGTIPTAVDSPLRIAALAKEAFAVEIGPWSLRDRAISAPIPRTGGLSSEAIEFIDVSASVEKRSVQKRERGCVAEVVIIGDIYASCTVKAMFYNGFCVIFSLLPRSNQR
jgi:hypothetical protein